MPCQKKSMLLKDLVKDTTCMTWLRINIMLCGIGISCCTSDQDPVTCFEDILRRIYDYPYVGIFDIAGGRAQSWKRIHYLSLEQARAALRRSVLSLPNPWFCK